MKIQLLVLVFATSSVLAGVVKIYSESSCQRSWVRCTDGVCVNGTAPCNNEPDNAKNSDELQPNGRTKADEVSCQRSWVRCTDGVCVNGTAPCNSEPDNANNSDKLQPNGRTKTDEVGCQHNWVRCTDGNCVNDTAACNNEQKYADNSDKLQPNGRTKTDEVGCQHNWVRCTDGKCVNDTAACNDEQTFPDNSDELQPNGRTKTDEIRCKKTWSSCTNGVCVNGTAVCNGDTCTDISNELEPNGQTNTDEVSCQHNWVRCTDGNCINDTAACNNEQKYADNSDKLQPNGRTKTDEVGCQHNWVRCTDGKCVNDTTACNDEQTFPDNSDELQPNGRTKTDGVRCKKTWSSCTNGVCVNGTAVCNGDTCTDISNELQPNGQTKTDEDRPSKNETCVVPPYPEHGSFLTIIPGAKPGDKYDFITLRFTCQEGYDIQGEADMYCNDGAWQHDFPKCVRLCQLNTNSPGVEYWCEIPNSNGGTRICNSFEPNGTTIFPKCKEFFYSQNKLPDMHCLNGFWDYVANCIPECGTVTPHVAKLIINGTSLKHGELPWHVGIYSKNYEPYMQICGGSIISSTLVISAAHCFWDDWSLATFPASEYAVGAGKIYRPWNEPHDPDSQKTDVRDLKIPPTFSGVHRNYADDIALVFVSQPFTFKPFIRPVCLNYEERFELMQLHDGNLGKVAGWGLTAPSGIASEVLKVVELPFVNFGTCIARTPIGFKEHLTSEKFCAGYDNGTALCQGDSGGGLAFPSQELGITRYYLRGVVSTSPQGPELCNAAVITSFTQISKQYSFIRQYHSSY